MIDEKSNILLADDHEMFLDGISLILREAPELHIEGRVLNGKDVLHFLAGHRIHLVLMDIHMPVMNGIEALREIRKRYPDLKVLILSMHHDQAMVKAVMQDGANGYLLKSAGKDELLSAVRTILNGGKYFSGEVVDTIYKSSLSPATDELNKLTDREIEIIRLVAEGLSSQEIGDKLFISPRTVETHRKNIMAKLELKNVVDMVRFAFQHKLID